MATYNEIADKIHGVYHRLRITIDGNVLSDVPDNVVFTNTVNDSGGLEIGTTYCSQIAFTIENPSKDLNGEELYIEDGVRDTDGTFQYSPVGYFRVDTVTTDRGTASYTCYDRMAYALTGNYDSALTFPTTDKAIIEEICKKCNIAFTGDLTAHTVQTKPTGIYKTVLAYMLQLQGKNAFFDTDGTMRIKWYEKADYTIDDSRIYSDGDASTTQKFTFGFVKNTRTVAKTETKYETQTDYNDDGTEYTKQVPYTEESSEEQTYSAGDGLQGVSFTNPYMTQEIVTELYNKLKGFEYTPATFQVVGDFRIRVMTIISAVTNNGTTYAIPVMNVQHSCDGGLIDLISSYGQSESSNELADTSGLSKSMARWDAEIAYLKTANVNNLTVERAKVTYADISTLNATNATVKKLDADTVKTSELEADVAKLGYVTASTIEAQYARLDKANIPTAWIDTAMIGEGVVGTVQIADGSITDAKIVGMTANKITAGKIDAGEIEVVNLNAANITVGTINGKQIASGAIDTSKLDSELTDWISSTDTDVDKALKDAGLASAVAATATSTANAAQDTADKANEKIDNLKVGGRNLLLSTKTFASPFGLVGLSGKPVKDTDGFYYVPILDTWNNYIKQEIQLEKEAYTISFYAKADSNVRVEIKDDGSNQVVLGSFTTDSTSWKRYAVAFTVTKNTYVPRLTILTRQNTTTVYIKGIKLEKGNKATDWTPAPEDVDSAIDSAQNTADSAQSSANAAQSTANNAVSIANGKTTAYYQTAQPSGGTYKTNDLWFDTDGGYQMYYYNGSKWVATQYGSAAILASAITAEKIAASAVTSGKIAAGAVVADAIAANAVTAGKIATNAVTASTIAANAVTTDKVAANAITSVKIATDAVTAEKIVAGAITSAKIAASAITSDKILAGAVTADKISVSDLYTIKATIGGFTIDNRSIHIGTPDKIYFVEDLEIMSTDDMQRLTAGEIDTTFDAGAVYIGQNMIALAYNWFKSDGTFNIGKGAISFDGETIYFGGAAQDKFTQICKDTVTTSYINALKVTAGSVAAENITGTTITGKTIVGATITGSSINVKEKIYSYSGTDYYMSFERNPWGDATRNGVFSGVNVSADTWNNPALMGLAVEVGTDGSISTSIQATSEISICTGYFSYGSTMNNGFEAGNGLMIRESGIEVYGETEFDSKVTATSFVNSSSKRYKTNIEDMTDDRALKLLAMRPVSYDYIDTRKGRDQLGLIAEEVDALESYPVSYDKYNRPDGLDYSRLVPMLIKLCQIQQKQIDNLQTQIAKMAS